MGVININRLHFGGFIGACIAAGASALASDYLAAAGLVSAALSAAGGETY